MSKRSPARSPYGRRFNRSQASFCSSVRKLVHADINVEDNFHFKAPRSLKSGVLKGSRTPDLVRKKQESPLRIRWTCPPKFILNDDWFVATGEQSEERRVQEQRETGVTDAIYSHPSAVPRRQSISFDDDNIPIIPITPIEDEEADPLHEVTPPSFLKENLNSKLLNGVQTSDLTQYTSQQGISVTGTKPNGEKHPLGTLSGLEADVGAAASAAFTALVKSNEQGSLIDTDLLIKVLNDPKTIELLRIPRSLGNDKATTPQDEAKVAICSSSLSTPEQENLYMMQPDTDRHIVSEILAPKHVIHSEKLFKQVHKASDPMVNPLNPILEPPLPPKQEEPSNSYTTSRPTKPGFLATLTLPGSSANLNRPIVSEICAPKQAIHSEKLPKQDHFITSSRPTKPGPLTTSTLPGSSADLNRHIVTEILAPKDAIHSEKLPKQDHFITSSRPLALPGSAADKNKLQFDRDHSYYKSLVRQHGHERQDKEQRINKVQASFPKTCIYFNSRKGCRLGLSCSYRHQDINHAHRVSEAPIAKRVKLNSKIVLRL